MNNSIVPCLISFFQSISSNPLENKSVCFLIWSLHNTEAAVNDKGVEIIIHKKLKLISSKTKEAEITNDHENIVIIREISNYLMNGWKLWYSTKMNSRNLRNTSRENITIEYFLLEKEQTNTYATVRAVFHSSIEADLFAEESLLRNENLV